MDASDADSGDRGNSAREVSILEAAATVFRRYGFKKTSMDDLARAAGLSRQGLYLHFATKEALFKAAVDRVLVATTTAGRAELMREGVTLEDRLVTAFVTMHGHAIGPDGRDTYAELLETAASLMGERLAVLEAEFDADLTRALRSSGVAARWRSAGVSAKELAAHLRLTSVGAKKTVTAGDDYRDAMRAAARIVCRGAPEGASAKKST